MVTYPVPTHIVRPLSPITELTTPASARSISLPVVEREYDYKDESPIVPRAQQQGWGVEDGNGGDGDSVYSQGSTRTVIPDPPATLVRANTTQRDTSPLPSPPGNLRPFPTPAGGLPPPPRSGSLRGFPERSVLPASPGLAYLQETGSALASPIAPHTPISPTHSTETKGDAEDVDRISVASVSSAGVAGVGAGAKTAAPGPRSRSSSIVVPEQTRPGDRQARGSANHRLSWINTPVVASPAGTSTPRSANQVGSGQIHDQPKSADMQSRISATYHPSWANIPVLPSPHGSPRESPAPRSASSLGLGHQRPRPPIRMASAHPSLVNIPIMNSPVPSPRVRPKSIHGTGSVPADTPLQIASNHSLVNIPFLPSPVPAPTPPPRSEKRSPTSRLGTSSRPNSPSRSRPSSPKSRPSTLKKRPISLQTSRPTSWHSQKTSDSTHSTIKAKKSAKGKRSSMIEEGGGAGSSNDNHSDISAGAVRAGIGRRGSRMSALLSIFSQTSTVTSPTNSAGGHSPLSPTGFPNLEEEIPDELKCDTPPLAVIRTSGTFGIQDDGSAHLLLIDEPTLPPTATPTSASLQRQRRDSDNGTVKSAPLGPALYMGNPDPRDSIDEERDDALTRTVRSLTPFEIENPTSPLESVLNSVSPLESASYERKSVEGPHSLLVIPGRSDVGERAQSTSTGRTEDSHSRTDHGTHLSEAAQMVDHWTQTSPASSIAPSSRSRRPLPKPPSTADQSHRDAPEQRRPTPTSTHHANSYAQRRPVSLPPPPPPSAYPQPAPPPPLPTSDLPLLIASHLLSNHATALMRHSAGLAEGAEMMKRMADESMQWGSILLNMASGQQAGSQAGSGFTMPGKTWSTDVQPTDPGLPHHGSPVSGRVPRYDGLPDTGPVDPTSVSRPIFQSPPQPSREPSTPAFRNEDQNHVKDDRYTPIPPRIISRRSRSRLNLSSYIGFYDEVEDLGRKGWNEIHQAEQVWMKGMNDLKAFLDAGPPEETRRTSRGPGQSASSITYAPIAERHRPESSSHPHEPDVSPKRTSRGGISSILRTDESFLPSPTDLLPSSIGTETDDSHLPSFNLMTPPDDSTLRARSAPHAFGRQPISAERIKSQVAEIYNLDSVPNTASTGGGYDSPHFKPHPAAYPILRPSSPSQPKPFAGDRSKTEKDKEKEKHRPPPFNLNTEVPTYAHEKLGTASTLSQPSTGTGTIRRTRSGRKLKKRSSAVPLQLAMIPPSPGKKDQQPDTAGSTIKSSKGKKHWWSRKKEGTGSTVDRDWRGSVTAV